MGILDEVLAAQNKASKPCKVGRILAGMPKKDRDEVEQALQNPDIQTEPLTRVLNNHGYIVGSSAMSLHRRGECCCVNQR